MGLDLRRTAADDDAKAWVLGCRVLGLGFRVLGFRGLGFRV